MAIIDVQPLDDGKIRVIYTCEYEGCGKECENIQKPGFMPVYCEDHSETMKKKKQVERVQKWRERQAHLKPVEVKSRYRIKAYKGKWLVIREPGDRHEYTVETKHDANIVKSLCERVLELETELKALKAGNVEGEQKNRSEE